MSKSEETKLHKDNGEKKARRISLDERMMQVLLTLAFRGPLNIREISQEIAKYTGEAPESVRVVIHRRFDNLVLFGLVREVGKKKVDITPFGALLLVFTSPSKLLNLAILHSLERRFPHLLKGISCLVAVANFEKTVFELEDEFASIKVYLRKKTAVFNEKLEYILNNIQRFKKVDFSAFDAFWRSLSVRSIQTEYWWQEEIIMEATPFLASCSVGYCFEDPLELVGIFSGLEFLKDPRKTFEGVSMFDAYSMLTLINYVKEKGSPSLHTIIDFIWSGLEMGEITWSVLIAGLSREFLELIDVDWLVKLYCEVVKSTFARSSEYHIEIIKLVKKSLAEALAYLNSEFKEEQPTG
ncbi:MAG: hypothetical protein QXT64_02310 [Desulfurococcaceae archaeon]